MGLTDAPAHPLLSFAEQVGPEGAVAVEGGRTQWQAGGEPASGTRLVRAPAGVLAVEPAEMTVRVLAGTTVDELQAALADVGQGVNLPRPGPGATVGGVLAVGHSDVRRLGRGPIRDVLLQARYVSADGVVVTAGGPTVKNVSGFDMCRLLVGSLGTLGLIGEVILRTRPLPAATLWCRGTTDPFALREALFAPAALLWDGVETWCCLEGHGADVAAEADIARGHGLTEEVDGPPALPPQRWSLRPSELGGLGGPDAPPGGFVAEIGVGTVHGHASPPPRDVDPHVEALNHAVKAAMDPSGRLNPGRDPLRR